MAADAVAEVSAGPRGVGKQRLQLQTPGGTTPKLGFKDLDLLLR